MKNWKKLSRKERRVHLSLYSIGIISIFPTNPTDDLVIVLTEHHIRLGIAKVGLDCVCVILAIFLKGEIGAGTILCTFGLGPVIDFFHQFIIKSLRGRKLIN